MSKVQQESQIILYESDNGKTSFNVNVFNETIWLTQKQMAELFQCSIDNISLHLKNIFREKELTENSVVEYLSITASDGKNYKTKHYSLDAILSAGYRIKSSRATQFRKWSNSVLKQYLLNGYAIDKLRIEKIEEQLNLLRKELKEDVRKELQEINKNLLAIANRPITINNQITNNSRLEEKAADLLDELIIKVKKDNIIQQELQKARDLISASPKTDEQKKQISDFFEKLGDTNSKLNKTVKGAGIAKRFIKELIEIGNQFKDWF